MLAAPEAPRVESPGADRGLRSHRRAAARARDRARVRREGALPYVEQYEREERYPLEQIRKLPALGLMGPMIPERYGGSKSDVVTYGIICEELARADWVVASVVSVSNSLAASSILRWGNDAQKEKWLPAIAAGDCICSACLTEPGGGTDLGNMKTTATRVPGGWRINGTKVFISHAAHAGCSSWWRRSTSRRSTRA
jgi:glutaryl-CoA dehydrogenase